jgi:hypothetical protein
VRGGDRRHDALQDLERATKRVARFGQTSGGYWVLSGKRAVSHFIEGSRALRNPSPSAHFLMKLRDLLAEFTLNAREIDYTRLSGRQ